MGLPSVKPINITTVGTVVMTDRKKGELEFVRLLMPHASPVGILKALIAAADGKNAVRIGFEIGQQTILPLG